MAEKDLAAIIPPMGIAYIASYLEKFGHEAMIFDFLIKSWRHPQKIQSNGQKFLRYSIPFKEVELILDKYKPDLIGISCLFAAGDKNVIDLIKQIKDYKNKIKIVLGGTDCSARPEYYLKNTNADFVIVGEGEVAMADLVKNIEENNDLKTVDGLYFRENQNIVINKPRQPISKLDEIPFPAWHLMEMDEYLIAQTPTNYLKKEKNFLTVLTSRGCVRNCIFCSGAKNLGSWRSRSAENVLAEIKEIIRLFNVKEIQFLDANISISKERLTNLCDGIINNNLKISWIPLGGIDVQTMDEELLKKMKKSGCYFIPLGIEHGNIEMQKTIGKIVPIEKVIKITKICKKIGIWTLGLFVIGLPGENSKTLNELLNYAIKSGVNSASFFTATPLPGSRLYDLMTKTKNEDLNLEKLGFYSTEGVSPSGISNYNLNKLRSKMLIKFMLFQIFRLLNPINIFYIIINIKTKNDLKYYLGIVGRFLKVVKS